MSAGRAVTSGRRRSHRDKKPVREPLLHRLGFAFAKFFLAALFGLFISWIAFDVGLDFAADDRRLGILWVVLFCVAPLVWGILGIFFFDKMLGLARRAFEDYLGFDGDSPRPPRERPPRW